MLDKTGDAFLHPGAVIGGRGYALDIYKPLGNLKDLPSRGGGVTIHNQVSSFQIKIGSDLAGKQASG